MGQILKPGDSECYAPLSEPFRLDNVNITKNKINYLVS
jgi:hypothetical protein